MIFPRCFATIALLVLFQEGSAQNPSARCDIGEVLSANFDDPVPVETRFEEANTLAQREHHVEAALAWANLLRRTDLASHGHVVEAMALHNLAQSLVEIVPCVSRAGMYYSKGAAIFEQLEDAAEDDSQDATRHRQRRAGSLIGAAIAERALCGGDVQGTDRVAKGKRKHCLASRKLLQHAQRLQPENPVPILNEGNLLVHLSKPVEAANRYLAAVRMDPTLAYQTHPLLREFVLTWGALKGGREVKELMDIAWFYALPRMSLNEDCSLQKLGPPGEIMVGDCTWEDFKIKNPEHSEVLKQSMLFSWQERSAELLQ